MIYGSVCSGIEAATVAWHPLGWKASFFSEIEKFPRAVLQHHYPLVPLHGDFTTIQKDDYEPIDLLVGGTPCQSFSIAGLRGGLDDARGNLALEFLRLVGRLRPRWVLWENVPGVLSSSEGRDFGAFLGGLGKLGYGFAYRVFDAQFFGLAQRRSRLFVAGYFGDWRRAAAVLFESESLRGDPAPRRKARETVAALTATGVGTCGADDNQGQAGHLIPDTRKLAHCLNAHGGGRQDFESETFIITEPPTPVAFDCKAGGNTGLSVGDIPGTLRGEGHGGGHAAVAFALRGRGGGALPEINGAGDSVGALRSASGGSSRDYIAQVGVRRLTPRECERLQGFPDDYTLIPYRGKPAADGPRYKSLGNSMAVPVMRWIGSRIEAMEQIRGAG